MLRRLRPPSGALPLLLSLVLGLPLGAGVLAPAPAAAQRPDGLEVLGWILESGSDRLVARNAGGLDVLSVSGVGITAGGDRVGAPGKGALRLLRAAHHHGLRAELLIGNYDNVSGGFDPRALHRLLAHPRHIAAVARRLARFADDQGWDGVNVDFERVRRSDGDGLVQFVQTLRDRMDPERTVSVDVSASHSLSSYRDRGYRLAGLGAAADVIALMTYDMHGPTWSGPGPIGSLDWQRRTLEPLLEAVPADRVLLGVAGYGYTWPRHGTGRSLTVRAAHGLVNRDGATAHWRPRLGEWTARLSDGTVLWWSDRRSYHRRTLLARDYGLRGLAVWRVGSADPLR